jgi:thioredoxin-like negative regulator of GroEL
MTTTRTTLSADPFTAVMTAWDVETLGVALAAGDVLARMGTGELAGAQSDAEPRQTESSVTLARLYLRQGHVREARTILREILHRDPADRGARLELDRIAGTARKLRAADLLPESATKSPAGTAAPALRLALLRELLRRLQSLD